MPLASANEVFHFSSSACVEQRGRVRLDCVTPAARMTDDHLCQTLVAASLVLTCAAK